MKRTDAAKPARKRMKRKLRRGQKLRFSGPVTIEVSRRVTVTVRDGNMLFDIDSGRGA